MEKNIQEISRQVEAILPKINEIFDEIQKVIVGQKELIERLFMGLISDGHILIEGVPGLAKTTAVKTLADVVHLSFQRIQFTPDLLPADITGTQIYNPKTQEFFVKKGPLFHNIILADEINRAPAKVQSALLEAMQEKQITIGDQTYKIAEPFTVLATQNPIEQEGTYPLPEAQVDRFMLKLKIQYPTQKEEIEIMNRVNSQKKAELKPVLEGSTLLEIRDLVRNIYIDPKINDYIVRLVFATRQPQDLKLGLERYIQFGASPRASICLNQVCKAYAFLNGRGYVVPQDVKTMALDVLRHRLLLSFEAEAEGLSSDEILNKILNSVEVP